MTASPKTGISQGSVRDSRKYQGTFTGGGYTISDMYIYRENEAAFKDGVGLFGYTNSATISELTVKGEIEISGNSARQVTNIGGVVGCAMLPSYRRRSHM